MIYVYMLLAALWAGTTGVAYFKGYTAAQDECDLQGLRQQLAFERSLSDTLRKSLDEQMKLNDTYERTLDDQEKRFTEMQKKLDEKEEGNICIDREFLEELEKIK